MTTRWILATALLIGSMTRGLCAGQTGADRPVGLAWPAVTKEARPWTYWWWMGSAVDRANLTGNLEAYRRAGLGGVLIIPIYGVKGWEDRYLDYLSPAWMKMLIHTTRAARRLGMGVDMTTGTGWPFGGPQVTHREAAARLRMATHPVAGGSSWHGKLDVEALQALVAHPLDGAGSPRDLTGRVRPDGTLHWTAPPGRWELLGVFSDRTGQQVKRAAPGGRGLVLDPFSTKAMDHYLQRFDRAFAAAGLTHGAVRAQYHDSFEYHGADWTDDLFSQFQARRGYDLRTELPALFGRGPETRVARVKADYRRTLADLHLAYISDWNRWAHDKGCLTRNQAHGAPGNLLDLYAAVDIPETEIFGHDGGDPLFSKLASSAAHVTGKQRVSSETCTWLGEHFQVALADCKPAIDRLLVSGINHIFYHGIAYSPASARWPGWLFYASVNFGPSNSFWHDFSALNAYVTRCQSILQAGQPANDVMLYFPFHDLRHDPKGTVRLLTVHSPWLGTTAGGRLAGQLWDRGYGFDYISDRQLSTVTVTDGRLRAARTTYRTVVVPSCTHMPVATFKRFIALARGGATVVVDGRLPADVPGWGTLADRRKELRGLLDLIHPRALRGGDMREASIGSGRFIIGTTLEAMLARAGVRREPLVDRGLQFIRRTHDEGYHYFLVNASAKSVDGWVPLAVDARAIVVLDPMTGSAGVAASRRAPGKPTEVRLQLQPGESCILRVFTTRRVEAPAWRYLAATGRPQPVIGPWTVTFIDGGPTLPAPLTTARLDSWTAFEDASAHRFAGTARYDCTFEKPAGTADDWVVDLGRVAASARVRVNGRQAGILFAPPFRVAIGRFLHDGKNTLQVEVTNLAANRIADMDRRHIPWRIFHEINFVNIHYKPFDASKWPPMASGLLGPVRLVPMRAVAPRQPRPPSSMGTCHPFLWRAVTRYRFLSLAFVSVTTGG